MAEVCSGGGSGEAQEPVNKKETRVRCGKRTCTRRLANCTQCLSIWLERISCIPLGPVQHASLAIDLWLSCWAVRSTWSKYGTTGQIKVPKEYRREDHSHCSHEENGPGKRSRVTASQKRQVAILDRYIRNPKPQSHSSRRGYTMRFAYEETPSHAANIFR